MKLNLVFKEIVLEDVGLKSFFPVYPSDIDKTAKMQPGEIRLLEIKNPRNLKHHNKFMAMIRMTVDNSDDWRNEEHLLFYIKTLLGYGEYVKFKTNMVFIPSSISFESMEQQDFEEKIYNPGIKILADILGITPLDIESNYDRYL